jgi:hypothetical protein
VIVSKGHKVTKCSTGTVIGIAEASVRNKTGATLLPRRKRILRAKEDDTVYLEELFDIGWPKAPHRVLRNSTVAAWEAAGRPATGLRPGERGIVATSKSRGPIVRFDRCAPQEIGPRIGTDRDMEFRKDLRTVS